MCGIVGILNTSQAPAPTRTQIETMVRTLQHRGPDGYGYYTDEHVGLGHARLSIIDLSTGDQPIHNPAKSAWTVFNGEIFNYIELRAELEREGRRFYTQSDTEVIVHLYDRYGDRFVEHLNGQFAIALWDQRRRRLVLARDRAGIRPLFYTQVGGRLYFASEIKSLLSCPELPRRLSPAGLAQVFTYWSCIGADSVFEGIRVLPPGHILTVEEGRIDIQQYWDWDFSEVPRQTGRSAEDYAQELRALLIDAVRLQLRADVPVGAYLSGGLDSSIICSLIREFTSTSLRTFSIGFEDAEFDETEYQAEMARHLGTHHTAVRCTKRDIADNFARVIWHSETPVVRTAPTPLMLLSRRVREEGYKVVLTGEGADEVFGGYDLFKEAKIRRFWARDPHSKFRPRILERLYPYLKHSPSANKAFSQQFFGQDLGASALPYFAHLPRWTTTRRAWQFFSPELRESFGSPTDFSPLVATLPQGMDQWPGIGRDQYVEAKTLLAGYLLCSQGDRMGMANSIEGRFPFLDHRVIEFANRLPPQLKIRGLVEKFLLRKSMAGLMPDSIRTRTKQPYRAPDSASFFVDGMPHESVVELLSESRLREAGYFEPRAVAKLVEKSRAGRAIGFADNMAFIGVLSTMMVDELFIKGRALR